MEATLETTPPKRKKKEEKKIKRPTPSSVLNPAWRRHICPTPTPSFLAGDNSTDARLKKLKIKTTWKQEYLHQLHPVRPRNSPFSEFHRNVLHPPSLSLFPDMVAYSPPFSFPVNTRVSCVWVCVWTGNGSRPPLALLTVPSQEKGKEWLAAHSANCTARSFYLSGGRALGAPPRKLVISCLAERGRAGWGRQITTCRRSLRKKKRKGRRRRWRWRGEG